MSRFETEDCSSSCWEYLLGEGRSFSSGRSLANLLLVEAFASGHLNLNHPTINGRAQRKSPTG